MKKVLSFIFWLIVIVLMCLWTYEFYRVRNGLDPQFCIKNNTHTYADGVTTECIGIGYKVYKYDRYQLYGTEFTSIFAKERTINTPVDDSTTDSSSEADDNTDVNTEDSTETNNTNTDGESGGEVLNKDSEVVGD